MPSPSLIVSIVRKGWGDTVLEATMKAGAYGGTVLYGRGVGRNEHQKLLGIQIAPEKEIVLTVITSDQEETILQRIVEAADLEAPGHGLAFILPITRAAGVRHLIENASP